MQIKSVIINNIHYINFNTFNISTFFFFFFVSWFTLLKLGCVLYTIKYTVCVCVYVCIYIYIYIYIYLHPHDSLTTNSFRYFYWNMLYITIATEVLHFFVLY